MALRDLVAGMQDASTVGRVFGEPIERDGVVVIPVARVQGMFGGGQSDRPRKADGAEEKAWGGGGGWSAVPEGAYLLKNGELTWLPAMDLNRTILLGCLTGIVSLLVIRGVVRSLRRSG